MGLDCGFPNLMGPRMSSWHRRWCIERSYSESKPCRPGPEMLLYSSSSSPGLGILTPAYSLTRRPQLLVRHAVPAPAHKYFHSTTRHVCIVQKPQSLAAPKHLSTSSASTDLHPIESDPTPPYLAEPISVAGLRATGGVSSHTAPRSLLPTPLFCWR